MPPWAYNPMDEEADMKRAAWVLAVVVAAGVVAAGFWWSQKRTRPYEGLAQRFPAKAEV